MKRREFITLLGGTAAWSLVARAQQPTMPVIGYLNGQWPGAEAARAAAFRVGLTETGFVEGRNIAIEYRWAEGQPDRLPALAADLVRRKVAAIAATGGDSSVRAAKALTATIPIVFSTGGDPVQTGLVASLNRPGGNATGATFIASAIGSKRLDLLHSLVPVAVPIGLLVNPINPSTDSVRNDLQAAARSIGQQVNTLNASSERDIDVAFETFAQRRVGMLVVSSDAFLNNHSNRLVALAARYAIPTIYTLREIAAAGGLMSYGADIQDTYRQVGVYTGRILKGEKPADLPVQQPTKFELVINLKTARALGLEVPDKLLALADEVIE
jgi:putative tryptophan/tyrosine transport system substrate-binding protein